MSLNRPASFADVVGAAIRAIPAGRVATYGQVARLAGSPRAARLVVWVLNSSSKSRDLPWHRVISAQGRIALKGSGFTLQRRLLRGEGVTVSPDGTVDLDEFGWQPQHPGRPRRPTTRRKETK